MTPNIEICTNIRSERLEAESSPLVWKSQDCFFSAKGFSISRTVLFSVTDFFSNPQVHTRYVLTSNLPVASGPDTDKWIWHLLYSREWRGYPASCDSLAPNARRIKGWSAECADFVFSNNIQKWIWKLWLEYSLCLPL